MGKIVDYNLSEELEHGVYVSCLVRELSRELALEEPVVYELTLAALLHDIGKLRLANYLYGEEKIVSPMVVEEMKYVRLHPVLSSEILKEYHFSDFIQESVKYHHEDYDGSGYPANLKGGDIPLGARIIRICDVFAALTADRPYRKRFSEQEAINLMIDEVYHFDMKLFLCFQRVVHRGVERFRMSFTEKDEEMLLAETFDICFPDEKEGTE